MSGSNDHTMLYKSFVYAASCDKEIKGNDLPQPPFLTATFVGSPNRRPVHMR